MDYYNKKLLRFLYGLTKLKNFMSHKDMARELSNQGFKISPKTVERWLNFLSRDYKQPRDKDYNKFDSFTVFNYFPTFFYEKLGLKRVKVIIKNPSKSVLKSYPLKSYTDYATWLYDCQNNLSVLSYDLIIPIEKIDYLKKSWYREKERKNIADVEILVLGKPFMITSPTHEVIDRQGIFHPERNDRFEISRQIGELKKHIECLPESKMLGEIRKNPLILPVIFEQHRRGWSSPKIWGCIKKRLGPKTWDFIKHYKKKSDELGIKRVQKSLEEIKRLGILHSMKLIYMPLQLNHNFYIYVYLKFNNLDEEMNSITEIALKSVQCNVYPMDNNEAFIILSTNSLALPKIFEIFSKNKMKRVFFLQHEKSLSLLTNEDYCVFDYRKSFDPLRFRWIS